MTEIRSTTISTSRARSSLCWGIVAIVSLLFFVVPLFVSAQSSLSLSVSPTLFEMSAAPGQEWSSAVRIINPNPYDITVYGDVVNFAPQGESGRARFLPVLDEERSGTTIAEWITLSEVEFTIPAEQTIEVPFTITVPAEVSPGGHFGAILVGTRPPETAVDTPRVETSQIVTALIFLRVEGDVIEQGGIRSFRTTTGILDRPEASFELRFENNGNVHLQPQGQIEIFNMWGEVRGEVPINRNTMFGNVLPESVRKYEFTWTGDWSLADIGRYRAVATLAYGEESRQFSSQEAVFWVIPWQPLLLIVGIFGGFFLFLTWAVKLYIRRALGVAVQSAGLQSEQYPYATPAPMARRSQSVTAPIERGILDLRQRYQDSETFGGRVRETFGFIGSYRLFFFSLLVIIGFIWLVVWFVQDANTESRPYEVEIGGVGGQMTLDSEDIEYEKRASESPTPRSATTTNDGIPPIRIVNQSGLVGLAAEVRLLVEAEGVEVVEVDSDIGAGEWNTVIVYHPDFAAAALELSKLIDEALLSAFAEADPAAPITVYVGRDSQDALQ